MTTATTTLTDFLLARIAEDETVARTAVWVSDDPEWNGVDTWDEFVSRGEMQVGPKKGAATEAAVVSGPFRGGLHMPGGPMEGRNAAVAAHIARHDPARVLAECEAKRRIIALAEFVDENQGGGAAIALFDGYPRDGHPAILATLAQPYANHPDYRDEWRA